MLSSEDFRASFQAFMRQMASHGPKQESPLLQRIKEHFGCDPSTLPVVSEKLERYDHPSLHLAIEEFLADENRSAEVVGISAPNKAYTGVSLAQVVTSGHESGMFGHQAPTEGPVEYTNIPIHEEQVLACVKSGLYLIRDGAHALALLIDITSHMHPFGQLRVEVMAAERKIAEEVLGTLRALMRKRNVYRGHVVSLEVDEAHSMRARFHRLPKIAAKDIVLPEGLMDRIERQTVRFTQYGEALRSVGRHLKRGILLHGPPGTGKTLTAMYLASAIKDRSVFLITGRGQGLIEQYCSMARMLQPSIVIVEDVDLIAEERTHDGCTSALLFELLNQMDGLAEDADVLFLLTSNRPDLLEPALASRPGRVDQAIEIPLPDAKCRQRLFDLYGGGLPLRLSSTQEFIKRTEGASAAFIRELFRKAALFAADETGGKTITVEDRHVEEALRELVLEGGDLTKRLLGFMTEVQCDEANEA